MNRSATATIEDSAPSASSAPFHVRATFEPGHRAVELLAAAYATVRPIVRRLATGAPPAASVVRTAEMARCGA